MNDHVHKIGIIIKPFIRYGCVECFRCMNDLEAMVYLERVLGPEKGMEYWRALRALCEKMRFQWRKGIRWTSDGGVCTFLPE